MNCQDVAGRSRNYATGLPANWVTRSAATPCEQSCKPLGSAGKSARSCWPKRSPRNGKTLLPNFKGAMNRCVKRRSSLSIWMKSIFIRTWKSAIPGPQLAKQTAPRGYPPVLRQASPTASTGLAPKLHRWRLLYLGKWLL